MRPARPQISIPGDQMEPGLAYHRIMCRSAEFIGMSPSFAVWRFGFAPESESAIAFGVHTTDGFTWALTDCETGEVLDTFVGMWTDLPSQYKDIIGWEHE